MNKYKSLFASLLLLAAAPACTDLEEEAFDILPAGNYYQDENSIVAAVTRPYEHAHWNGWDGDRWLLTELTADQFVWAQKGRHGQDGGNWVRLHRHEWTPDEGAIYGGWIGPYQGIGQVNVVSEDLAKLDYTNFGLTEADQASHINELRVLRAWFYTFLIDYFRSVPIVTKVGQQVGNSTPQEVFTFIETELKEALPNLPQNTVPGRWDQGGAAALLVRIYLNSEAWTGTPRYDDAAVMAQKIIDGEYGTYSLDPDYRGPFRSGVDGYRSPENIFEFPHARNLYEFGWMYNAMQHYQARYSLDNNYGGWNGITLSPSRDLEGNIYDYELGKPYEHYADDDLRKQPFRTIDDPEKLYEGFFLIGQQYGFNYDKKYGFDSTVVVLGTEEYIGDPLFYVDQVGRFSEGAAGLAKGSHVETGEENSGVRLLKFPWLPDSRDLFMTNSAPEIRLAEIYYALAEAKYRAGDKTGAAELLDAVRVRNFPADEWAEHSYVQNPGLLTDEEFVDELGREFLGERHRRTDLVRWGMFGDAWWDKAADAADKTVFPIPARALNANPLLKPNGYE
ncbi:RagB/SusD family nutrient uptake outer membrane protein [Pontibacter russatus]|uniref:RagB/SusD family nutrient uptake outer membrane protein n=1 Tax=Pontibacter russatus TaxID=2694929 RepID=UPI00137A01EB|nr:RagB/SusD family nutrient uptake outer membrane protein [Pontibacter russatus]